MNMFRFGRTRLVAGVAALLVAGSFGVAAAVSASTPASNASSAGRGVGSG